VREHLRACAGCRATLRAYRAAPGAAAALAPALPLSRSFFERAHDAVAAVAARFGGGGDTAISQVAASGGTRGAGIAALAKVAAICAGTAGGAAACVAAGVVPAPLAIGGPHEKAPAIERRLDRVAVAEWDGEAGPEYEDAPEAAAEPSADQPTAADPDTVGKQAPAPAEALPEAPATASGAVEYAPEPASTEPVSGPTPASGSGNAAGEFGP